MTRLSTFAGLGSAAKPLVIPDCGDHVDWDCYYGTFVPVLGLPLLFTDRCQQQLNAYQSCIDAKDAGYTPDAGARPAGPAGGGPVPRGAAKPPSESVSPWAIGLLAVGALVLFKELA